MSQPTTTRGTATPVVTGLPLRFLRAEGIVLLAPAPFVTGLDEPWWLVPLLLLMPDVLTVGYSRSARPGAWLKDTHLGWL